MAPDTSLTPALKLDDVERVENISRAEFEERFVRPQKPAIIRGFGKDWAAWQKWTPDYFKERFGDRIVSAITTNLKGQGITSHYGGHFEITMREYFTQVLEKHEDFRLGGHPTRDLAHELLADGDYDFPDLGHTYSRRLLWLFFGCKGSRSPIHYDFGPFHVFHVCFMGKKTFHLFPLEEARNLHAFFMTTRAPVDSFHPDFEKYPRLRDARGWRCDLDRSDTLYMPAGIWHDVQYHEASIALTLRFTEDTSFVLARVIGALMRGAFANRMAKAAPQLWARLAAKYQ